NTASVVKMDILATVLYQNQKAGRQLSATQKALATKMITASDNDAATALWNSAGGAGGVATANRAFGLTQTKPNYAWGMTTTTPAAGSSTASAASSNPGTTGWSPCSPTPPRAWARASRSSST